MYRTRSIVWGAYTRLMVRITLLLFVGLLFAAQSVGIWHTYAHLNLPILGHHSEYCTTHTQHETQHDTHHENSASDQYHAHQHCAHDVAQTNHGLEPVVCEMLDHLVGPAFIQAFAQVFDVRPSFIAMAYDFTPFVVPHTTHFLSTGPPVQM
jgi:hypothetical protein